MNDEVDKEVINIYREEKCDNDASYVPFGFAFQADAGILLFIMHFSEIESISIESELQDIELIKKNGELILAQAKSSQDPMKANNEKEKLFDALFSLIKCNNNESDTLIYISNLPDPLKSDDKSEFNLREVNYKHLSAKATKNVDELIEKIKSKLDDKIKSGETKKIVKERSRIILEHLIKLNKEKLYFISIPKYYGDKEKERISEITNKIQSFLFDRMKYKPNVALLMSEKIYKIWHGKCFFDSTISAKSNRKIIKREELIWPLVTIFCEELDVQSLQEVIEEEITNEIQENVRLISQDFIKLNNFELVNNILSSYEEYRKSHPARNSRLNYIKQNWINFADNFEYLNDNGYFDDIEKKCAIMFFMYSILENYGNVQKILKGGEVYENN